MNTTCKHNICPATVSDTFLCECTLDRQQGLSNSRVSMPKELTAENGAKKLLIGEFSETVNIPCDDCDDGWEDEETGEECELCKGTGNQVLKVAVEWSTIKEIYAMAVKHLAQHHTPGE